MLLASTATAQEQQENRLQSGINQNIFLDKMQFQNLIKILLYIFLNFGVNQKLIIFH